MFLLKKFKFEKFEKDLVQNLKYNFCTTTESILLNNIHFLIKLKKTCLKEVLSNVVLRV